MRNIAILCLLLACALPALAGTYRADEIPNVQRMDRRRYVSDPDGILSPAAVAHIDSVCASLRERGLAQVAVVAVDDIAGGDTFSFAVDLFRSWGVGSAKSNNGLGILLVKDLREIRFVTGGGLEGILPDALCKRIQLNYMLPAFREGDYSAGMVAGVGAAATILEGGEVDLGGDADEDLPAWMILTIVFGFVIFPLGMVLANYYFSRRCPKCRKLTLKQQSQQVLSVTRNYRLVEYTYVCPNCGAVVKRRSRNLRDDNFGGGAGGGELEDTALEAGSFVNAGAGWNTVRFREAFEGVPHVVCQVESLDCTIQIKDITAEGFLYCLRTLSTGSYYTGASTGTQPSHSATTLVSGTTTTATAVKIHYIAVEYGGER